MPCRSDVDSESRQAELRAELDSVTAMLCALCAMSPASTVEAAGAKDWYAKHVKADEQRRRQEAAEARRRELRASALGKLTKEERDALRSGGAY